MRSAMKSTAWLSSGYGATILGGVITAKVLSLLLGPVGYGYMALYGTLLMIGWAFATYGIPAGLTRMGGETLAEERHGDWDLLRVAAFLYQGGLFLVGAIVLIVFHIFIGILILHRPLPLWGAGVLSAGFLFGGIAPVQMAVLRTERRVREVAMGDVFGALLSVTVTVAIVYFWRDAGLIFAVTASAAMRCLVFSAYARWPRWPRPTDWPRIAGAVRRLSRFVAPVTVSLGIYNLPQFLGPVVVVHVLGSAATGLYAAAFAIGKTYVGFLPRVMGQDYYPRIARLSPGDPDFRRALRDQQELIIRIGLPLGVLIIASARFFIPVVYTARFLPMTFLLDWLVVVDVVRYMATCYDYLVLAKCDSQSYLRVQVVGGTAWLLGSLGGLLTLGLVGMGVGWAVGQTVRFLFEAHTVKTRLGITMARDIQQLFVGAVLLLGTTLALEYLVRSSLITVALGALGISLSALSFTRLRAHWRRGDLRPVGARGAG